MDGGAAIGTGGAVAAGYCLELAATEGFYYDVDVVCGFCTDELVRNALPPALLSAPAGPLLLLLLLCTGAVAGLWSLPGGGCNFYFCCGSGLTGAATVTSSGIKFELRLLVSEFFLTGDWSVV